MKDVFKIVRWGEDKCCLDELDVTKLRSYRYKKMTLVLPTGEQLERKMVACKSAAQSWWADRITGILFDTAGSCLSSNQLRLQS